MPTCSVSTGLETRPTTPTARLRVATTKRRWAKSIKRKLRHTSLSSRRRNYLLKRQVRRNYPRTALTVIAQASKWHSPWCKSRPLKPSQDGLTSQVKSSTRTRYRLSTTSEISRTIRISLSTKSSKSYLRTSPASKTMIRSKMEQSATTMTLTSR